jgi:hypothetical protein
MALETLIGKKSIAGFEVGYTTRQEGENADCPIFIDFDKNEICFKIQKGPIKEVGVNGCQVDTIIEAAVLIIKGLNEKFPCEENQVAIDCFEEGLDWLNQRKKNREARNVEGTSQA